MKKHLSIGLAGLAIFWMFAGAASAENKLPELVKNVQPAVVTVVVYDNQRNITGLGSGFFVDAKGHLLTNHHVLKGASFAEVKTGDDRTYPVRAVVAENEGTDLVKVRVDIPETDYRWVEVDAGLPEIAEQVVVVGSPLGLEQTVSVGIVSAVRELPGVGKFFQISAPISQGSSGSPVINMDGRVIGVVSFMMVMGQNLNFAVSGENVMALEPMSAEKSVFEWTYGLSLKTPSMAESLCRKGFTFSVNGEFDKALDYYKQATEKDPSDGTAWYGLGSCYIGLGDSENVLATYRRAIAVNPEDSRLHYLLGNYYAKLGQWTAAAASYQESIQLDPEQPVVYHRLGAALVKRGLLIEAVDAHKSGLRIDPENPQAHYNLGVTLNAAGKPDEAIIAYEHAVRLKPDYLQAYNNMGLAYGKMDQGKKAVAAHQNVIRIQPEYAPGHFNLGVAYLTLDDAPSALMQYKILKRLDPLMADRLFNLIYTIE